MIQIYKSPVSCVQCDWVGSREIEREMLIFHSVGSMWTIYNYVELAELYWRGNCNRGKNFCPVFRWLIIIKQILFNTHFVSAIKQSLVMIIKLRAAWVQIPVQLEFCCATCTLTGRIARTFLFLNLALHYISITRKTLISAVTWLSWLVCSLWQGRLGFFLRIVNVVSVAE